MPVLLSVVGSVNLDLVARADRLPRPGETVSGATFSEIPGGKGANQAVAAARLGATVRLFACVGNDAFADLALAELRASGVNLDRVRHVDTPTGIALIAVDGSGENVIVVAPGANGELRPDDIELPDGEACLAQLEIPIGAVEHASETASGDFFLNAAPGTNAHIPAADVTIVNRYEYEALAKDRDGVIAVTLGAEGAMLLEDGVEVARAVPPPVTAVDGTAAGDAFTACFVVSLLEGRDREEALRRACTAGAIAASRFGAQTSLPTADEVNALL